MRSKKADESLARIRATSVYPYTVTLRGVTLHINRGVYPSSGISALVAECLEDPIIGLKPENRMLDYGTGVGFLAIVGAGMGASVVATDINSDAVQCAKQNIALAGYLDRVDVREGPELSTVQAGERFDVIAAGMPFEDAPVHDLLERALYDPEFIMRRALFTHARELLAPGGRIFTTYSQRAQMLHPIERFDLSLTYLQVRERMHKGERDVVYMITP